MPGRAWVLASKALGPRLGWLFNACKASQDPGPVAIFLALSLRTTTPAINTTTYNILNLKLNLVFKYHWNQSLRSEIFVSLTFFLLGWINLYLVKSKLSK